MTRRRSGGTESRSISIGAISRATQIPVETLRAWERSYGAPKRRLLQALAAGGAQHVGAPAFQLATRKRNPLVVSGLQDFRGVLRHTRGV